ncbi:glycosyltransferase family 2 protein [Helicobacter brantae]|uniref:Glycosyltransferase 2-like domain-containing protein n=1 Tax=Helicobacter brantae TaxID=375927 RepID=A0A3D8J3S3_9HELI|nr:glycosyltransferase family 2 protein [Helicobacter brantae]RDU72129.1 hypothetical protein CQA58_00560 [Helicobacter brantae]
MTSFSIVTIVYNDVAHIKETMESVINQSYKNTEYILVDGWSNDGTKEVIMEYLFSCATITLENQEKDRFYLEATHNAYPTLTFKFLSERDRGIYDAMNKGIALASKEWINFMNCGDRFYDLEVLQKVTNENIEQYDVVYGDLMIYYKDENTHFFKKTSHDLNKLYAFFYHFGHPNCFVKNPIAKDNLFNTDFKLSADYDLIYRLFIQKKRFLFINHVVATFTSGGASDTQGFRSLKEALKISLFYNQNSNVMRIKIYLFYLFALIKKIIKLYMPKSATKILLRLRKSI